MNQRQTLTLMELTVMLLIFALAAALCMNCFARLEMKSRETFCRDRSLVQLQNAAEVLRSSGGDFAAAAEVCGGTWDGSQWLLDFGEYRIQAQPEDTGVPHLGGADMAVVYQGNILVSIDVRWQEVAYET